MRFRLDPKKPVDHTEWHHWFAWHPVRIGPELVWLERVDRKGTHHYDSMGGCWSFEYRTIEWMY